MKWECFFLEAHVLWLLLLFFSCYLPPLVLIAANSWSERTSSVGHCISLLFCLPHFLLSCSHVVLMHKMVILESLDRGCTACFTDKLLLMWQGLMWLHWFVSRTNTSSWWLKSVGFKSFGYQIHTFPIINFCIHRLLNSTYEITYFSQLSWTS